MEHHEAVCNLFFILMVGFLCLLALGIGQACADTGAIYLLSPWSTIQETSALSGNVFEYRRATLVNDFPLLTKKCVILADNSGAICRVEGTDTELTPVVRRRYVEYTETGVIRNASIPKLHGHSASIHRRSGSGG